MNTALTSDSGGDGNSSREESPKLADGYFYPPPDTRWRKVRRRTFRTLMMIAGAVEVIELGGIQRLIGLAAVLAFGGMVGARVWLLQLDSRARLRVWTRWVVFEIRPQHIPLLCFRIAVLVAGRKHSEARVEWRGHLVGQSGRGLGQRKQVRAACGFLWAAVRYRFEDAADLAWRPVDAILGSRTLSNFFVWGPVIAVLVAIVHHDGRFGLVADIQDPIALGAFLYVVIKTGRWWRQIKLPEPKRRPVKKKPTDVSGN